MFGSDWQHERPYDQERFLEKAEWQLKIALWPRRCITSNRLIWFKWAYCGTWKITGPGDPAIIKYWMTEEYPAIIKYWMTEEEYIIFKLKGN